MRIVSKIATATALLLGLAVSLGVAFAGEGGKRTEKKNGVIVTLQADGKKDNEGQLVHTFSMTARNSSRKDSFDVHGVIHLSNDDKELSDCDVDFTIRAVEELTREIYCAESEDWTSFTFDLEKVEAIKP